MSLKNGILNVNAAKPDLDELIGLFYGSTVELGQFSEIAPIEVPGAFQSLLCHEEHMTVATEALHESMVRVEVLETQTTDTHFARKILLRRQTDDQVVLFGIPRIALSCLSAPLRAEIEEQQRPLGRILVRHNVMRTIHLDSLWRVVPNAELCRLFERDECSEVYGRTARIDFDNRPAVELLEIVPPIP